MLGERHFRVPSYSNQDAWMKILIVEKDLI
jgi:hypothetical protein